MNNNNRIKYNLIYPKLVKRVFQFNNLIYNRNKINKIIYLLTIIKYKNKKYIIKYLKNKLKLFSNSIVNNN